MDAGSDPLVDGIISSICPECGADVRLSPGRGQLRCGHCDGGLAVDQGLLVRLGCPVCGGNFYYIDGSMSGRCPYCDRALLALDRHRVYRFLIVPRSEPPAPGAELWLLPFWRLRALCLGWDLGPQPTERADLGPTGYGEIDVALPVAGSVAPRKRARARVIDLSLPDPATLARGVSSLRLRAAVFPVEPFGAHHEQLGTVVAPTLQIAEATDRLYQRALAGGASDLLRIDCQRVEIVAQSLGLLFYPFWVGPRVDGRRQLYDAVSGDVEERIEDPPRLPASRTQVFDELKVVELTCANCGAELERGNRAVVFPCRACGHFWVAEREGLAPFRARHARLDRPEHAPARALWLPFWRVAVALRYGGRWVRTVGDLRQIGLLRPRSTAPSTAPPASDEQPLVYYAPAYGALHAPRLDFAARDLTRLQPQLVAGDPPAEGELFNCFYGPEDAQRLAYVIWIELLPGSSVARRLRSLRITTGEVSLWYLPFAERGRELVGLINGLRYDRTAFRGVRH